MARTMQPFSAMSEASLQDVYVDALWDLRAGAEVTLRSLSPMVPAVSDHELASALQVFLGEVSHRLQLLEVMVARFSVPARLHAEELETLAGHAMRFLADGPAGEVRDIGIATVCRAAIHYAIPEYELATVLARTLGYEKHAADLEPMLAAVLATDKTIARLVEDQIRAHTPHATQHPDPTSATV
jgi:ferritin-like metal-binding protein YciE